LNVLNRAITMARVSIVSPLRLLTLKLFLILAVQRITIHNTNSEYGTLLHFVT